MPIYRLKKRASRYTVIDARTGQAVGTHHSPQAAASHIKALRTGAKAPETAAGRRALSDADFVLSSERVFPITSAADVKSAVNSWGRYRGPTSFETFKQRLTELAKRKGFASALPTSWGVTGKAGYGAGAGQQIAGDLYRGGDGKFSSGGGGASAAKPKPKGAKQPKKTEAERAAERDAERAANREKVYSALGLPEDASASLNDLAAGKDVEDDGGLVKLGLAEVDSNGKLRLTDAGRTTYNAASRGDAGAARDAASRGQDRKRAGDARTAARQQRESERAAKRSAAEAKRAARLFERNRIRGEGGKGEGDKKGGGGGGGGKGEEPAKKRNWRIVNGRLVPTKEAGRALAGLPKHTKTTQTTSASASTTTSTRAAPQGHPRVSWVYSTGASSGGISENVQSFSRPQAGQRVVTETKRSEMRSVSASTPALAANAANSFSSMPRSIPLPFTVFKDARGQYRWLGLTSNGYEDRDREILATKALAADVARADADGRYGPLRWWHIGHPDPTNADAPWGPGLDLGTCDFNAMSGSRILVESGTFKSAAIAEWAAANAAELGLSPGFFHPPSEPSPDGVFSHIRRFERSLAPRSRVSNPFTSFTTSKELRPMDATKIKELIALGLPAETVATLLSGVEATEKTAQASGVRYKANDAPAVYTGPDGAPGIIQDGRFVALKAAMPPAEEEEALPPEEEAKADPEELMEDAAEDADAAGGDLLDMTRDDLKALFMEVLAPLVSGMKIADKVEGMVKALGEETKALMGGVATKTASTDTALTEQAAALKAAQDELTTLKAQLAELRGDAPAGVQRNGYRASADPATALPAQIAAAVTGKTTDQAQQSVAAQTLAWFDTIMTTGVNPDAAQTAPPSV